MVTYIPNKGEQMVRYCGYYSNKSHGMRKKAGNSQYLLDRVENKGLKLIEASEWRNIFTDDREQID